MLKHLVYIVHGSQKFYDQARLSILTGLNLMLKQQRQDYRIYVFADQPARIPVHPWIEVQRVDTAQLKAWRGPLDYVHRIKLELLREAAQRLNQTFIYVDCDTRWLALPDAAFAALNAAPDSLPGCVMHVDEGALSAQFFPQYLRHLHKHRHRTLAQWPMGTGPWHMWNAGAIGVAAKQALPFFNDALALCDQLLLWIRPRLFAEQLALSLLAQSRFKMHPLGDPLHHYWAHSFAAPYYLQEVFATLPSDLTVEQQAARCATLPWDESRLQSLYDSPPLRWLRRRNRLQTSLHRRRVDCQAIWLRLLPTPFG